MMPVANTMLRPFVIGFMNADGVTILDAEANPVCNWSQAALDSLDDVPFDYGYNDDVPIDGDAGQISVKLITGELPF